MNAIRLIPCRDYMAAQQHRSERDFYAEIERAELNRQQAIEAQDIPKIRIFSKQIEDLKGLQEEERQRLLAPVLAEKQRRDGRKPHPGEVGWRRRQLRELVARHDGLAARKADRLKQFGKDEDQSLLEGAEQDDLTMQDLVKRIYEHENRLQDIADWKQEQAAGKAAKREEAKRRKWDLECQQRRTDLEEIARQFAKKMRPRAAFFFDSEIQDKIQVQTNGSIVVEIRFEGHRKKY